MHACMQICPFIHCNGVFPKKRRRLLIAAVVVALGALVSGTFVVLSQARPVFCKPFGSKAVNTATSGTPVYPMVLSRGSQPNTFFLFHAPRNLSIFFSFDMGNRINHGTTWWAPYPPHPSKKNMSSALGPTGSVSSLAFFFLHPSERSWPFTFGCALQLKSTKWAKLSCLLGSTWLRAFSFWNNGGTIVAISKFTLQKTNMTMVVEGSPSWWGCHMLPWHLWWWPDAECVKKELGRWGDGDSLIWFVGCRCSWLTFQYFSSGIYYDMWSFPLG